MIINLNEEEALHILDSLHGKYMSSKVYFKNHSSELETIGVTEPETLKTLYNNLLEQMQVQGEYKFLDKIK
ncbi:MAG: hypothetical protein E6344_12710 [Clostridium sp.]|uniref:hypothetical protein n=1 Tax=Clostridium culturomicium TaxID=1499683 RepID=UPI00058C334E|nr:hypothetical protein [Clostridium culturomicium]MDU4891976.1 hypothetical protein [Clostridium sp.]MDU7084553.1 hypothetical protein [Clostridium sp.]